MKALLTIILMSVAINVQAHVGSPEQLTVAQQDELIEMINRMDPEMIATAITEETLNWYIEQFQRPTDEPVEVSLKAIHGRLELAKDAFHDSKAPKFN